MMTRSTYQITLLLLWVVLVREVLTQSLPETAAPELQEMMLGSRWNQVSENEANEMGRTAAEDMGALMASPPVHIARLPQTNEYQQDRRLELSGPINPREADSPRYHCSHHAQWYPESSGRAAARTIPLAPLPGLPLASPVSVPLLTPLLQSLMRPGGLGLGLGGTPLLRASSPSLRTPFPRQLPTYNRVWIPPTPSIGSYTPNSFGRSANQERPLIFYV